MAQQTRKDPRARVLSMTVRYKSATLDEFIEHHSHDVSRGGMFIKTPQPFPPGTLLKFEVRIAEDRKVMQGVGRVVWKRDASLSDPDLPGGMGVKFIKLDDDSRRLIDQLLALRRDETSAYDAETAQGVDVEAPVGLGTDPISVPPSKARISEPAFFPKSDPAELPPPEDRTVMKQAAELLEEAMREVGTEPAVPPAAPKVSGPPRGPAQPKAPTLAKTPPHPPASEGDRGEAKPGRSSKPSDLVSRLPAPKMPPGKADMARPSKPVGAPIDMASLAQEITDKAREAAAPNVTPAVSAKPPSYALQTKAAASAASRSQPVVAAAAEPTKVVAAQPSTPPPSKGSGRGIFWFLAVAACAAGTWWLWKPRPVEVQPSDARGTEVREAPKARANLPVAASEAAPAVEPERPASAVAPAEPSAVQGAASATAAPEAAAASAVAAAPEAPTLAPVAKVAAQRSSKKAAASNPAERSEQNVGESPSAASNVAAETGSKPTESKPAEPTAEAKPAEPTAEPKPSVPTQESAPKAAPKPDSTQEPSEPAPASTPKKRKASAAQTDNPY
jgi:uncharacterized protein (TIGR02266 family)